MFRLLPTRVPTHGTRHRHARKQPPTRTAVLSSHFADPLTHSTTTIVHHSARAHSRASARDSTTSTVSFERRNHRSSRRASLMPPRGPKARQLADCAISSSSRRESRARSCKAAHGSFDGTYSNIRSHASERCSPRHVAAGAAAPRQHSAAAARSRFGP